MREEEYSSLCTHKLLYLCAGESISIGYILERWYYVAMCLALIITLYLCMHHQQWRTYCQIPDKQRQFSIVERTHYNETYSYYKYTGINNETIGLQGYSTSTFRVSGCTSPTESMLYLHERGGVSIIK